MMNRLVDKVRERRKHIYIFIITLFSGVIGGVLSASIYDYLVSDGVHRDIDGGIATNTSQTMLFGVVSRSLFLVILFGVLLFILIFIAVFKLIWIPENVQRVFPLKLIYNRKEGVIPLLSHSNHFLFHAGYAFQELSKERPEIKKTLREGKNLENFILEMIEYLIIMWLSQKYHTWWALEQYTAGRWHGKNKPSKIITFLDLPDALRKENIFFSTFSKYYGEETTDFARNLKLFRITLPKKTTLEKEMQVSSSPSSLIRIKNRYCKISINIFHSYWLVGVPINIEMPKGEEEQDKVGYFQDNFATIEFLIDFKVHFSRWWSLLSSSDDYYQWVDNMLEGLYEAYCWTPFVEKFGRETIKIEKGASFGIAFANL